ncbi:MAG: hypothetical protein Q4C59_14890, partial [Lachnospiraceae bacterium]|nr:hypothetical protein [Lachnospiraceae bacterium]
LLDGSCYFDSGIIPDLDTNTELKMQVNSGPYLAGARDAGYKYGVTVTDNFYAVRGTVSSAAKSAVFWSADWVIKQIGNKAVFNSSEVDLDAAESLSLTTTYYIGNMNNDGSAYTGQGLVGRIYYVKIFSGSDLVRDMVPVKKSDGSLCMYDKVTKAYYMNLGTGTLRES